MSFITQLAVSEDFKELLPPVALALIALGMLTLAGFRGRRIARRERELAEIKADALAAGEKATRLHELSLALARACNLDAVAEAIVSGATTALGADQGVIWLLDPEAGKLEIYRERGMSEEARAMVREMPLDSQFPAADAARSGEPIWIESREELLAAYPHLTLFQSLTGARACIALPLRSEERPIGSLSFWFRGDRSFGLEFRQEFRAFTLAIGRMAAESTHRALRFEAERGARQDERVKAARAHAQVEELKIERARISGDILGAIARPLEMLREEAAATKSQLTDQHLGVKNRLASLTRSIETIAASAESIAAQPENPLTR